MCDVTTVWQHDKMAKSCCAEGHICWLLFWCVVQASKTLALTFPRMQQKAFSFDPLWLVNSHVFQTPHCQSVCKSFFLFFYFLGVWRINQTWCKKEMRGVHFTSLLLLDLISCCTKVQCIRYNNIAMFCFVFTNQLILFLLLTTFSLLFHKGIFHESLWLWIMTNRIEPCDRCPTATFF